MHDRVKRAADGGLRIELRASTRDLLEELARAEYPAEACGLLVGSRKEGLALVHEVTHSRNLELERAHERFTLDPVHLMQVETDARLRGLDVLGVWHTHPDRPALPSDADRAAACDGWSYVIVAVTRRGVTEIRSWRVVRGDFAPEQVEPPFP